MKLTEEEQGDLRAIRNNVVVGLLLMTCGGVITGITYLVTVLPPALRALQEDVAPLAPRILLLEKEITNQRIDIERLKEAIK